MSKPKPFGTAILYRGSDYPFSSPGVEEIGIVNEFELDDLRYGVTVEDYEDATGVNNQLDAWFLGWTEEIP